MVTITLPPELEQAVEERAKQRGTTVQMLIVDMLREHFPEDVSGEGTMADFFAGYIGSVNSAEVAPGGSDLSEHTGRKFRELMRKKHGEGKS